MATRAEFAAFVQGQLGGEAQGVTLRRMFGEYGLHGYGKFFAVICDDTLFVKPTRAGEALLRTRGLLAFAPPYKGAKDYLRMDDLDDAALLAALRDATLSELPEPRPKKPRQRKTTSPP